MCPFELIPTHAKLVLGSTDKLPSVELPMTYAIDDPIRIAIEVTNRTGKTLRIPACFAQVKMALVEKPWLEVGAGQIAIHAGKGVTLEKNIRSLAAGYYTAHQNKHYPYLYDTFLGKSCFYDNGVSRWELVAAKNGIPMGALCIYMDERQIRVRFSDDNTSFRCATYEKDEDGVFVQTGGWRE